MSAVAAIASRIGGRRALVGPARSRYTGGVRRGRVYLGASVRFVLIVAVLVALVAVPLVTIYRSRCERGQVQYSFVLPWDDPPAECRRHESGFEILRSELGLDGGDERRSGRKRVR
jgi:hypothetical protein